MEFDDAFFNDIGLEQLSAERKREVGEQLVELTQNRVAAVLSERLSDEELERFEEIADKEGDDASVEYMERVVPDYTEIVSEQAQAVKQDFVNDMQTLLDEVKRQAEA